MWEACAYSQIYGLHATHLQCGHLSKEPVSSNVPKIIVDQEYCHLKSFFYLFFFFYLLFLRANKKVTVQADENKHKTEHNMVTPLRERTCSVRNIRSLHFNILHVL